MSRRAHPAHDRFVDLPDRGRTWIVDRPGPRRAPTVLLLHGWRASATANWQPCLDALSEHARVVALDHRGHGQGIRSADRFRLEDCADDAAAVLDELHVRRAIVVGYSMGGPIGQLLWQRHPERVRGLVFCATAADFRMVNEFVAAVALDLEDAFNTVPRPVRMMAMKAVAGRIAADEAHRDLLVDGLARYDERAVVQAGGAIGRYSATDWIGAVDVPTEVVVTEQDGVVAPERQWDLAELIPAAETSTIDAGHLSCSARPELFAAAIDAAVQRVARRGRRPWWRMGSPATSRRR
ncbi:MAG: alpha/beta hydrolase [Actinomycetota bacterium]